MPTPAPAREKSQQPTTAPTLLHSPDDDPGATSSAASHGGALRGKRRRDKRGEQPTVEDEAQPVNRQTPVPALSRTTTAAASSSRAQENASTAASLRRTEKKKKKKAKGRTKPERDDAAAASAAPGSAEAFGSTTQTGNAANVHAPPRASGDRDSTLPPRLKATPDCFKVPLRRQRENSAAGRGSVERVAETPQFETRNRRSQEDVAPAQRDVRPPELQSTRVSPEAEVQSVPTVAHASPVLPPVTAPAPAATSESIAVLPGTPHTGQEQEPDAASDMELSTSCESQAQTDPPQPPVPTLTVTPPAESTFRPGNTLGLSMGLSKARSPYGIENTVDLYTHIEKRNTWAGISFPSWRPRTQAFPRVTSCTVATPSRTSAGVRRAKSLPLLLS